LPITGVHTVLYVSTNNAYNNRGRDSNKPASALPTARLRLSHAVTLAQARISGGGYGSHTVVLSEHI